MIGRAVVICVVGGLLGCDGPRRTSATLSAAAPVPWEVIGAVLVDDAGRTEEAVIEPPPGQRYLAVRVGPAAGEPATPALCYRLEEVRFDDTLVVEATDPHDRRPICANCVEPVRWGAGQGLFVFPADATQVRFRVAVRDCALGIPASRARFPKLPRAVRIEAAWEAAPPEETEGRLAIRAGVVTGSGLRGADVEQIVADAALYFEAVGIALRLDAIAPLAGEPIIALGPAQTDEVDALQADLIAAVAPGPLDRRFVSVLFVGCLRVQDPLTGQVAYPAGQVMAIPGGAPRAVLIATGACGGPPDARSIAAGGRLLAHELGHHLGLFHSDHPAGRAAAAGKTLMHSRVLDAPTAEDGFSAAQGERMRRHPDVVYE